MRQFFDAIAKNHLFEGIEHELLDALLSRCAPPKSYSRGALLLGPQSHHDALSFIVSGSALVYKPTGPDKHVLMSRLSAGDAFGMAALFGNDAPYPTEIIAEAKCAALMLPRALLEEGFARAPRLAVNYIALLSSRIQFLTKRLEALAADDLPHRLLRLLEGFATSPGASFALPFSLSQLAEMLGTSRASLYRTLDMLKAKGLLARDGKTFTLLLSN